MKKNNDALDDLRDNWKQVELLREKLRNRLSYENQDYSSELDVFDRIVAIIQMDPALFRLTWLQPILDAGASYEVAFGCIAQSYIMPN